MSVMADSDPGPRAASPPRGGALRREWTPGATALDYLGTVGLVALTLGVATLLRAALGLPDLEMLFLLAVVVAAVRFGRGPGLTAASLGVACYDFFFVPPLHTFDVADKRYFLSFAMMFGAGFVASEVTARLRRQQGEAVEREERMAILYAMAKDLAATDTRAEVAAVAARHAADAFAARAVVLEVGANGTLAVVAEAPSGMEPVSPAALEVARWAVAHGEPAGLGTETLAGSGCIAAPLRGGGATEGALLLVPSGPEPPPLEQRSFLEVFCRQVAVAGERSRLAAAAHAAALRAKTEELRSSLLSAVSHDLRTPLASITGAATSLRDDVNLPPRTREELVASICAEAVRLERLVANLLDMTRLESGAIELTREWVPLDELVGAAMTRLEERLGDRRVVVELPLDLPLVQIDPVSYAQVFVNLLENAAKYTPLGSPLGVRAWVQGAFVRVDVLDAGPGLPEADLERVFEKFHRGAHGGAPGVGLGLAICRAVVEAHGGTISARNLPGGGAGFRLSIPLGAEPPRVPISDSVKP